MKPRNAPPSLAIIRRIVDATQHGDERIPGNMGEIVYASGPVCRPVVLYLLPTPTRTGRLHPGGGWPTHAGRAT